MTVASSNFQKLLEPGLRKLFFEAYDEKPEQYGNVFNVKDSKKAKETDYHVAGLGIWEEKQPQGPIAYEDINAGDEVTYTHKEYAKGIQIERKMVDDEMYGVVNKLPKTLGKGCRVLVETTAAGVLNNAFATNGYDGVPLFSNSHPLRGNAGGTCDNLASGALDSANLKAGLMLMRGLVDDAGMKIQAEASDLVIPADLEFTALTLLNSAQVVGSGNNDINVLKSKVKPVVMDYLTSATAWFLRDASLNELNFFWRIRPEFKGEENFDTMVAKYRGYARFTCGYSDFRGWVGSTGT